MNLSDIRLLVYMALNAPFKDGSIRLTCDMGAIALKMHRQTIHESLLRLRKYGLVEKTAESKYRVKLTYSTGKHGIQVPALPLFPEE